MAYPTDRVILHDRAGNLLPELAPDEVFSRIRTEEINGEHEMVVVTTRRMEEGWRALTVDATGTWREWVLTEPDEAHENGETALGTYRFVWSLQYDLTTSYAHTEAEAGMGSSCTSLYALQKALEGVSGWEAGTCDAPSIEAGKGCVMIYESAWSRLSKVVEATGGEVDVQIAVSNLYGVTSRKVSLRAHVGSTNATRRFDWGHDVANIHRVPDPGPYYCRIVPLGRGEQEYAEDDETTFEWPLDITDETGDPNLYYVQDDEAAEAFKVPDGRGGWLYPTKAVSYSEDDPELLLNAARDDLHNHTRPGVTYEANVFQFAEAGMDVKGVALGDDVHIVDKGFNPDAALRIQGRIVRIEVDELSPETTTVLTIGSVRNGITTIAGALTNLIDQQRAIGEKVARLDTAAYLRGLLDRINAEISATGGYAYLVPGEGIITYDAEVADPLVGTEATQVVQIKGGSIRIANSKKASFAGINDWEWKTVFTSGHILSELVTAAQLTSGYIGSPTSGNYWNLDTGELRMASVVEQLNLSAANLLRNGDFTQDTTYWVSGSGTTISVLTTDSTFSRCLMAMQNGVAGSVDYRVYADLTNSFRHKPGSTYSISFWAKSNSSSNTIWCCQGVSMTEGHSYVYGEAIDTTWKRYSGTITADTDGGLNFFLGKTGNLFLANVMLVEGDKPMLDWSPNHRDVLVPVDNYLTQTEIFNRLTNNGSIQGLYMENGNLYVNATYIKSGTLDAELINAIGDKVGRHATMTAKGLTVYSDSTTVIGQIGYGETATSGGTTYYAPYYTLGIRKNPNNIGMYSLVAGKNSDASAESCVAIGDDNTADLTGAIVIGHNSTAHGNQAIAIGSSNTASNASSIVIGNNAKATGVDSVAIGSDATADSTRFIAMNHNYTTSGQYVLVVGSATTQAQDKMRLDHWGEMWTAAGYTQASDRRLKEHVSYLGEEASEFVRSLKPALFVMDGSRRVGFYAQDVQDADQWDTDTVTVQPSSDGSLGFDPLSLDYQALIAPLVAYTQQLERRIEQLENRLESMDR